MAITRRVVKTFGLVYLFPLLFEAAIKTHWLCYCVKFKYRLSSKEVASLVVVEFDGFFYVS